MDSACQQGTIQGSGGSVTRLKAPKPFADLSDQVTLRIHSSGSFAPVHDLHALRRVRPLSAWTMR